MRNKTVMTEMQSADFKQGSVHEPLHTGGQKTVLPSETKVLTLRPGPALVPVLHGHEFSDYTQPLLVHLSTTCGLQSAPEHLHLKKKYLGKEEIFGLSLPFYGKRQSQMLLPKCWTGTATVS